jgi:hypothetical protein
MGATKIMVIRHAEKPGNYNGMRYSGVNNLGTTAGDNGAKHLITLGWERAGALVTLFAPSWGPKASILATPQFLFASNPFSKKRNRNIRAIMRHDMLVPPIRIERTSQKKRHAWQQEIYLSAVGAGRSIKKRAGLARFSEVPLTSWFVEHALPSMLKPLF